MKLDDYLNPNKHIRLMSFPYNFGLIYDFFKPEIYAKLVEHFKQWMVNSGPLGKIGDHQDLFYKAFCATPSLGSMLEWPQNILISEALQQYLCGFFSPELHANQYIILGAHQHKPPSETSWKHTDFNIVSFLKNKQRYPGYLDLWEPTDCRYTDDTADQQIKTVKVCRYIACIYYLNNPDWQMENGGETGIYSGYAHDIPSYAKVAPINNSLFFFEINPLSFHAAQGTTQERNSLIWWYHTSPAYQYFKHQALVAYKEKHFNSEQFEYWSSREKQRWSIVEDPMYDKFEKMYEKKC